MIEQQDFTCPEFDLTVLREKPNSILIIGNSYSGKTDLAKKIIEILGVDTYVYSRHNSTKHRYEEQSGIKVFDKLFTIKDYNDITWIDNPSLLIIECTSSAGMSHSLIEKVLRIPETTNMSVVLIIKYPQQFVASKYTDFVFMLPDRTEKNARTKCRILGVAPSSFKQLLLDIDFGNKKQVMVRDRIKPNIKRFERLRFIKFKTFMTTNAIEFITKKYDEYLYSKFKSSERRYLSYIK